jgi:organic radical activating enzyme
MSQVAGPTAALAGIPGGIQAQGVWAGRRQLFIRFAAEAETATMYTADALANELKRSSGRSSFHSIAIAGRDPLANVEYLCTAFEKVSTPLPVMLDTDGQRPAEIGEVKSFVNLVQVTTDGLAAEAQTDRVYESIEIASASGLDHALVLGVDERTTDVYILRSVERAHTTSAATAIVIHPTAGAPVDRDRRWINLLERASALHADVRIALRLPSPTGMR